MCVIQVTDGECEECQGAEFIDLDSFSLKTKGVRLNQQTGRQIGVWSFTGENKQVLNQELRQEWLLQVIVCQVLQLMSSKKKAFRWFYGRDVFQT